MRCESPTSLFIDFAQLGIDSFHACNFCPRRILVGSCECTDFIYSLYSLSKRRHVEFYYCHKLFCDFLKIIFCIKYGICFADVSTAVFEVGELFDDPSRSKFRTLLVQLSPDEIVFCRENISQCTYNIFRIDLSNEVIRSELHSNLQIYNVNDVKSLINNQKYWDNEQNVMVESLKNADKEKNS